MNTALSRQHLEEPDFTPRSADASAPVKRSFRLRLLFAALYLCIGLGLRLESIRTTVPNPDEEHWVTRSKVLMAQFLTGHYGISTSHLGHPGIPAAAVMAIGQYVGQEWNERTGAVPYSPKFLDRLSASRIANALASSLVFLVLLSSSSALLGFTAVLLGTMFLALDCQHIALTRIAHIDGILTLLVTTCLLLYFSAQRLESAPRKLLAGLLWGLCIATKPTAAALVGIFLVYNVLRRILCSRYLEKPPAVLDWLDIWAVVIGHAVLGFTYTKLWNPHNTYLTKHLIDPQAVYDFERLSATLTSASLFTPCLIAATLLTFLFLAAKRPQGLRYHLSMLFLLLSTLMLSIWAWPDICGNLIRFWYWVAGLSHRKHEAYGMVWSVAGYGYPETWLRRLPSLVVLGIIFAVPLLVSYLRNIRSRIDGERAAFLLILFLTPIIWTLPLSISTKQTIRYVVPVYPAVFLFAAWGYVELWKWVAVSNALSGLSEKVRKKIPAAFAGAAMIFQFVVAESWAPNYSLYSNSLTGGLRASYDRGYVLSPVSYDVALQRVHEEAMKTRDTQILEVVGDLELMKYAYQRMYHKEQRELVKIRDYRDGVGADWVLDFSSMSKRRSIALQDRAAFEPVVELVEHGVLVYELYRVLPPDYSIPVTFPVSHGARQMGSLRDFPNEPRSVVALPSTARAGYIHFDQFIRVPAGRFDFRYMFARMPEEKDFPAVAPDEEIGRIEATRGCTKVFTAGDLVGYELQPIDLQCQFDSETRVQISVYWFGNLPLRFGSTTVQRIP